MHGENGIYSFYYTHVRDKELKYIRNKVIVDAISNTLWIFIPISVKIKMFVCLFFCSNLCVNFVKVAIRTFGTYVLSSDKNILSAEKKNKRLYH